VEAVHKATWGEQASLFRDFHDFHIGRHIEVFEFVDTKSRIGKENESEA
jgi:hypothetical protein